MENRATAAENTHKKFAKIERVVPEICARTNRQTSRNGHHNTALSHRGRSNNGDFHTTDVLIRVWCERRHCFNELGYNARADTRRSANERVV